MTIREFMQKYELIQQNGTVIPGGYASFEIVSRNIIDDLTLLEARNDLEAMGIDCREEFCNNIGRPNSGKRMISFILWDESWKSVCS